MSEQIELYKGAETPEKPLNERQRVAAEYLAQGVSVRQTARDLDIARSTLQLWLKEPAFVRARAEFTEAIIGRTRARLQTVVAPKAMHAVEAILDRAQALAATADAGDLLKAADLVMKAAGMIAGGSGGGPVQANLAVQLVVTPEIMKMWDEIIALVQPERGPDCTSCGRAHGTHTQGCPLQGHRIDPWIHGDPQLHHYTHLGHEAQLLLVSGPGEPTPSSSIPRKLSELRFAERIPRPQSV